MSRSDAAPELEESVRAADIVTCATSSPTPLVAGRWLKTGTFVDLVGSFSPTTREADDDVVRRARIFVDTFEGALAEAGDLIDPIARSVIDRGRIEGELADLVTGRVVGRRTAEEITLFKSVGTALEDLAATQLLLADPHDAGIAREPPGGSAAMEGPCSSSQRPAWLCFSVSASTCTTICWRSAPGKVPRTGREEALGERGQAPSTRRLWQRCRSSEDVSGRKRLLESAASPRAA